VSQYTADCDAVISDALKAWRPPPRLSLSEWADREFVLSPESAAEPGRWRTIPYQREILDSFTNPTVERVSVMKSARVGWTKIVNILAAYSMVQDPCSLMVVQPTIEDAEGYSREEITPMVRDVPALRVVIPDPEAPGQTLLHKKFPGGSLSMVGANSGRGFRRVSRKIVLFDETDGYPPTAGEEGDQIKLGIRRTEYFWDRKIGAGSTPLVAGASRIEAMFELGDQRRYFVPCPQCGHMAPLVFRGDGGHSMKWPEGKPAEAFFACQKNGCVIEHKDKRQMVERGEWRAAKSFNRHASFHIWAAYSYSPNATWGQIAAEFLEATAAGSTELQTFVNTVLGETWHEKGEAPEWERLYERREEYAQAVVPNGVLVVTAGVDVQRDRLIYEVVGWGEDKQSWTIDTGVIPGDPAGDKVWFDLDELLEREWPTESGGTVRIRSMAVDSGDNTQSVYNWGRKHAMPRVIAVKGVATAKTLIGAPTPVDVKVNGQRVARGYKVWPVGVSIAKHEFYGWLRLPRPTKEAIAAGADPYPPGYCHFSENANGEDYFKEITAEHLVKRVNRRGFVHSEWEVLPGRENHRLDCRVYARAAAMLVGLDRRAAQAAARKRAAAKGKPPPQPQAPQDTRDGMSATELVAAVSRLANPAASAPAPEPREKSRRQRGTWLQGRNGGTSRRGSWFRR
jgi:phage terminase large subunit GpA-like protein